MKYFALVLLICTTAAVAVINSGGPHSKLVTTRNSGGSSISDADGDGALAGSGGSSEVFLMMQDLINGPDTGLGDGNGSGVIVTIAGLNLADIPTGLQTSSGKRVVYVDSGSTTRYPYVYYSKNADGTLPGMPANLYASHGIDELALSIPDSDTGLGEIKVISSDGSESNSLPFTVRSGDIFHVSSSGNNSTGDGSWGAPWATVGQAETDSVSGATIYIQDVDTGSTSTYRALYHNKGSAVGSATAHISYVAYPGYQPKLIGQKGFEAYQNRGFIVSKLDVYSSNYPAVDADDGPTGGEVNSGGTWGIRSTDWGRIAFNRVGDFSAELTGGTDGCASRYQGAITGTQENYGYTEGVKVLGNEVYDYGCAGSHHLHHTLYFTIRDNADDPQIEPIEIYGNYLHGNRAKNAYHIFDQDPDCGDYTGDVYIHNNVVVDQAGAGINIGVSGCTWTNTFYVENNVIIDTGKPSTWDNSDPGTATQSDGSAISLRDSGNLQSTIYIRNNTVIGWYSIAHEQGARGGIGLLGSTDNVNLIVSNNIFSTPIDVDFIWTSDGYYNDNFSGTDNVWYYSGGGTPSNATTPSWDSDPITTDPQVSASGHIYSIDPASPAIDVGVTYQTRDIYGNVRNSPNSNLGAVSP